MSFTNATNASSLTSVAIIGPSVLRMASCPTTKLKPVLGLHWAVIGHRLTHECGDAVAFGVDSVCSRGVSRSNYEAEHSVYSRRCNVAPEEDEHEDQVRALTWL